MSDISGKPINNELELINQFTRKMLSEDELYCFSLILCDNEIDRDYERFSENSLKELEKLFVGVTGVLNHDPRSENQTARIFSCSLEKPENQFTSDGLPYSRLCARAYMPKTNKNIDFIKELESGIKKEVSIGCSVQKRICSVCGKSISICGHVRGRQYQNKLCFATLEEPNDAYEWSFVAVPAQKAAGVIKSYQNSIFNTNNTKGSDFMDIEKKLFSCTEQTFSPEEMNILAEKFRILSQKAIDGDAYRNRLETDIRKFAAISLPELPKDTLSFITDKMSAVQLEEFRSALQTKAAASVPLKPQLFTEKNLKNNNTDFKNI